MKIFEYAIYDKFGAIAIVESRATAEIRAAGVHSGYFRRVSFLEAKHVRKEIDDREEFNKDLAEKLTSRPEPINKLYV